MAAPLISKRGFPGSSAGKESICKAGDAESIPGSGRSTGEGLGYPLQYSWPSLVARLVKNPPAMWETWVQSLGWEGYPPQYSGLYGPWGYEELDTTERLSLSL